MKEERGRGLGVGVVGLEEGSLQQGVVAELGRQI